MYPLTTDRDRIVRLRQTKRLPLVLLLLMVVLFVVTLRRAEPWAPWVHAFAEAGMIGALADWFAVVALFRHPLGLPIPHTAIIPRRKNEIGQSLARFIGEHFLHPDAVRVKLESINLADKLAAWMRTAAGRERLVNSGIGVLSWMVGAWHEKSVRQFLRRLSHHHLERVDLAPLLAKTMDWLIHDGRHQQLLTQALRYSVILLHDHRDTIRGSVQRGSPWWLPGFIDDRILQQMLDRIETLMLQMSLDPDHPLRGDFDRVLRRWIEELRSSPALRRAAEDFRQSALRNEDLQEYFYQLWMDVVAGIEADIQGSDSSIRQQIDRLISSLAEELSGDEQMQSVVNRWLVDSMVRVVAENRVSIASLISDTVDSWDARETSQRLELAIGHDLQYIRINGTLVGGLVGLFIHGVTNL